MSKSRRGHQVVVVVSAMSGNQQAVELAHACAAAGGREVDVLIATGGR